MRSFRRLRSWYLLGAVACAGGARNIAAEEPAPRAGHAAVVVDGRVYVLGGWGTGDPREGPTGVLARVDVYDGTNNEWARASDMPTARVFAAAAAVDGRIYVTGGMTERSKAYLASVDRYDPRDGTWRACDAMPMPRSRMAAAVLDGKVFVVGGIEGSDERARDSAALEMYDPAADRWTRLPDMPTPRHALAAVALEGRLYAIGGYVPESRATTRDSRASSATVPGPLVESFDPRTRTWRAEPPMSAARTWFGAAVAGGRIYVLGGHPSPGFIESWRPGETTWRRCRAPDVQRGRLAVVADGALIHVLGGEEQHRPFRKTYDSMKDAWR